MTAALLALVVPGGLAGGYLLLLRRRPRSLPVWPRWRTTAWLAGTGAVALGVVLAVHATDDHRTHMVAHLVLGMYAPLALVLGAPARLLLGSLGRGGRLRFTALLARAPVRILAHPVTAALLAVGGLFVLYLTPLYAASAADSRLRLLMAAHFLLAGYLYTWAIAGPDPAPHRPSVAQRAAVLVLSAGCHAFLAKLLYARAGELTRSHGGHGTAEMETAAQLMYYGGDVAEVLLAVLLLAGWYRRRAPRAAVVPALP